MSTYNPSAMPPPLPTDTDQTHRDNENLRVLSVLYWVYGGLNLLCGCFPIFHVVLGFMIYTGQLPAETDQGGNTMPPEFGLVFMGLGLAIIALAWLIGVLNIYVGFSIRDRKRLTLCRVMACLACLSIPIGLALGVWSLVLFNRDSVRRQFEGSGG